jgi:hypothetical protein
MLCGSALRLLPLIYSVAFLSVGTGSGCSSGANVDRKSEGDWVLQRVSGDPIPVAIASGVISFRNSGGVYLKFRFLDKRSVLVTFQGETQLVLSVEYPDSTTMLWIKPNVKTPFFTFTRG